MTRHPRRTNTGCVLLLTLAACQDNAGVDTAASRTSQAVVTERVYADRRTGLPMRIMGMDDETGAIHGPADAERAARTALAARSNALGAPVLDVQRVDVERTGDGTTHRVVFTQVLDERARRPIFGAFAVVPVVNARIRSMAVRTYPNASAAASQITAEDARRIAAEATHHAPDGNVTVTEGVWPVADAQRTLLAPAFRVQLSADNANTHAHLAVVHGLTGALIVARQDTAGYTVEGTVVGPTRAQTENDPAVTTPLRYETVEVHDGFVNPIISPPVTLPGGPNVTDAAGHYTVDFPVPLTDKVAVVTRLAGPHFAVHPDPSGLSLNEPYVAQLIPYNQPSVLADIDWQNKDLSKNQSQTNVFHHLGVAYAYFVRGDGSALDNPGVSANGPLPVYTAIAQPVFPNTCAGALEGGWPNGHIVMNDANTVVTTDAGEPVYCPPLPLRARLTYHEYTHYVTSYAYFPWGFDVPEINKMGLALAEAYSFYYEAAISGIPDTNTVNALRWSDFDWTPCDPFADLECDAHENGAIASGFLWSFRGRGTSSYTDPYSQDYADRVVFGAIKQMPQSYEQLVLAVIAEDEAQSPQGTPGHKRDICAAAWDDHGIAVEACCEFTETPLVAIKYPSSEATNAYLAYNPLTTDIAAQDPAFPDAAPGSLPVVATICPSANATKTIKWRAFLRPYTPAGYGTGAPLPAFSSGVGLQNNQRLPNDLVMAGMPGAPYELVIAARDGSTAEGSIPLTIDPEFYNYAITSDHVMTASYPGTDPDENGVYQIDTALSVTLDCANHVFEGKPTGYKGGRGIGVLTTGSGEAYIENCTINRYSYGTQLANQKHQSVGHSTFEQNDAAGIAAFSGGPLLVSSNTLQDNNNSHVYALFSNGVAVTQNQATGGGVFVGAMPAKGAFVGVAGNTISNLTNGVVAVVANNLTVVGPDQVFEGISGAGVLLPNPAGGTVIIADNLLSGAATPEPAPNFAGVNALNLTGETRIVINENRLSGFLRGVNLMPPVVGNPIPSGQADTWDITNNTFTNVQIAASVSNSSALIPVPNLSVQGNTVERSVVAVHLDNTSNALVAGNTVTEACGAFWLEHSGATVDDNTAEAAYVAVSAADGATIQVNNNTFTRVNDQWSCQYQFVGLPFWDGAIYGVQAAGGGTLGMEDNQIMGFNYGVLVADLADVQAHHNTITDVDTGVSMLQYLAPTQGQLSFNTVQAAGVGFDIRATSVDLTENVVSGTAISGYRLNEATQHATLSNNRVSLGDGSGFEVTNAANLTLERNTASQVGGAAMVVSASPGAHIYSNFLFGSMTLLPANPPDGALTIYNSPNAEVYVNVVTDAGGGYAIAVHSERTKLFANLLQYARQGIGVFADRVRLHSNQMTDIADVGVHLWSTRGEVLNNYISAAGGSRDDGSLSVWNLQQVTPGYNVVGGMVMGGNYHSDYIGPPSAWGIGTPHPIAGSAGSVDKYPLLLP